MASGEPKPIEGVPQEEYDQKLAELRRKQAKGGNSWKEFMEKLARWAEGEGEYDMECQAEFPDLPMDAIRRIYDELAEQEESDEQWES